MKKKKNNIVKVDDVESVIVGEDNTQELKLQEINSDFAASKAIENVEQISATEGAIEESKSSIPDTGEIVSSDLGASNLEISNSEVSSEPEPVMEEQLQMDMPKPRRESKKKNNVISSKRRSSKDLSKLFSIFSWLLERDKYNERSLFFAYQSIEYLQNDREYNAKVTLLDGEEIYVKLTSMTNIFSDAKLGQFFYSISDEEMHALDNSLDPEEEQRLFLRFVSEKTRANEERLHEVFLDKNEPDYDRNYRAATGFLLNALIRTLKKIQTHSFSQVNRKEKSYLVVIDESPNAFFYHPTRKPFNENESAKVYPFDLKLDLSKESWNITDFFASILFAAQKEVGQSDFFNEIVVYFHEHASNYKSESYYPISTAEGNRYLLQNQIHSDNVDVLPLANLQAIILKDVRESTSHRTLTNSFFEDSLNRIVATIGKANNQNK